ncbi:MAG: hypothetical protein J0M12_01340 [Deltaproteobacteria bacterium]|nr:hypothetical protein [Deltaproteobacteria bacterium]
MFARAAFLRRGRSVLGGAICCLALSSCAFVPLNPRYEGPPNRPAEIEAYYHKGNSYKSFSETTLKKTSNYTHKKIDIETDFGPISIDYFQRRKKSDSLIFVLPVLGGRNIIADYFARYYAKHGFDTAIVNRSNDFKDVNNFDNIEETFRKNIVRDRIGIDFFEREYQKTTFGTFGISRGAINAAMTAGVDSRLKYNVLAMGGTDLVGLLRKSDQRGVKKFRDKVIEQKGISKQEFYEQLRDRVKTDPQYLARYMDARNTLMFLSVFDNAVPFRFGQRLRDEIGGPRTVYLLAGHYTSILYTQYAKLLLPWAPICLLPQDYIESEALAFYRERFKHENTVLSTLPYRILQLPLNIVASTIANDSEYLKRQPVSGEGSL